MAICRSYDRLVDTFVLGVSVAYIHHACLLHSYRVRVCTCAATRVSSSFTLSSYMLTDHPMHMHPPMPCSILSLDKWLTPGVPPELEERRHIAYRAINDESLPPMERADRLSEYGASVMTVLYQGDVLCHRTPLIFCWAFPGEPGGDKVLMKCALPVFEVNSLSLSLCFFRFFLQGRVYPQPPLSPSRVYRVWSRSSWVFDGA